MKPRIFIGSSVEGLGVAYAIQQNLTHDAEATVWDQGVFELSKTSIESLASVLDQSDFGIFVFSPDDITKMRDKEHNTIRDNVIFEFGLFVGGLGRNRVFFITPTGTEFHIPTDLLGVTPATYSAQRADGSLQAATGPACNQIREAMKKLPLLRQPQTQSETATPDHIASEEDESDWLIDLSDKKFNIAREKLKKRILTNSKDGDKSLDCWLTYIDLQEHPEKGLRAIRELAKNNSEDLETQKLICQMLTWESYYEEAIKLADQTLSSTPDNEALSIIKAECLKLSNKHDQAISILKSLSPADNPTIALELSKTYTDQGKTDESEACLKAAYKLNPGVRSLAFKFGMALYDSKKFKEALYVVDQLTIANPRSTNYQGTLSNIALKLDLYDIAMSSCRKAHELSEGKEAWTTHNIGNMLNNKGLYSDALEWLQKGVTLEPDSDYAHTRLASTLQNAAKEKETFKKFCLEGRSLIFSS